MEQGERDRAVATTHARPRPTSARHVPRRGAWRPHAEHDARLQSPTGETKPQLNVTVPFSGVAEPEADADAESGPKPEPEPEPEPEPQPEPEPELEPEDVAVSISAIVLRDDLAALAGQRGAPESVVGGPSSRKPESWSVLRVLLRPFLSHSIAAARAIKSSLLPTARGKGG